MLNLLLLLIATVLSFILIPILFLIGLIWTTLQGKVSTYYLRLATAIDVFGNIVGYPLFNFSLIKKDGYKFGNRKDTISYVLGMNKVSNKLTWLGKIISNILNKIDKNHIEKAIGLK